MSSFLFLYFFFLLWCVRILSNFSLFSNFSLQKLKYPKSVAFIICNEFCERFNFYGMRSEYFCAISSIALFQSYSQSSMWPIIICVFKHFSSFINFFPFIAFKNSGARLIPHRKAGILKRWCDRFIPCLYQLSIFFSVNWCNNCRQLVGPFQVCSKI